MRDIKVIAFDADDTLWVNEPNFQEITKKFCALFNDCLSEEFVAQKLLDTEMRNLSLYGYGAKSFMLSMIETLINLKENKTNVNLVNEVIGLGKDLLQKPVEKIDGVENVLEKLNNSYYLVVATKGDLLDQERKLKKSGLAKYFHHIEIMSDKKERDYVSLLHKVNCTPDKFLMIGNSLKSDIIPVLNLGGHAVHIPFHTTWEYEQTTQKVDSPNFRKIDKIVDLLDIL